MSQTNAELLGYLRELVGKTQAMQIPWQKVNPTTFSAHVQSANARMTIQRVVRPPATIPAQRVVGGMVRTVQVPTGVPAQSNFVLQVIEASTGVAVITLNAPQTDIELFPILSGLFEAIENIGAKKGLDLLKKIISS